MAQSPIINEMTLTPAQRRLLGGWRDILDDVRSLSRRLAAIPDRCECDATGHLNGSCACCRAAEAAGAGSFEDCTAFLVACGAQMDALLVDTLRFFPAMTYVLAGTHLDEAQTMADEVQHEIETLVLPFRQSRVAAVAFPRNGETCRLPSLKLAALALHAHAERLERLLKTEPLDGRHR